MHSFASRFASAGGRRTRSASALDEGVRTEQAGADPDELASAWDRGKSPGTLETHRWPVYKLLLPAYEREGIDSATKINQQFLDRVNAEPLESGLSPASVPLVPSAASTTAARRSGAGGAS